MGGSGTGRHLGVALSGGGVRAAMFGLGALVYLARSGANSDVRVISSASGGSITNAAFSMGGDFSSMTTAEAEDIGGRIMKEISHRGAFFTRIWFVVPTAALALFGCYGLLYAAISFLSARNADPLAELREYSTQPPDLWTDSLESLSSALLLGIALLAAVTVVFPLLRGHYQRQVYDRVLKAAAGDADDIKFSELHTGSFLPLTILTYIVDAIYALGALIPRRRSTFLSVPPTSVTHVYCATDLDSGDPFYFLGAGEFSSGYGSGRCPSIPISSAVYASAAFPLAFNPFRLRTKRIEIEVRGCQTLPRTVHLSDGGVFNNLATDWFRREPTVEANGTRLTLLVVNASAPLKPMRRFRLPLWTFRRAISILTQNTVTPRVGVLLDEGSAAFVLDITQSPIEALHALVKAPDSNVAARASQLLSLTPSDDRAGWLAVTKANAETKTKLTAVGHQRAEDLVRHGYALAMVWLHCLHGYEAQAIPKLDESVWLTTSAHPERA